MKHTTKGEVIAYIGVILTLFLFITMPFWWPFDPTVDCQGRPSYRACQEAP